MSKESKQARKTEIKHFKAMEKAIKKNDVDGFMKAADAAFVDGVDLQKGKNKNGRDLGDIVNLDTDSKISLKMKQAISDVRADFKEEKETKEKVTEALEGLAADKPRRDQGLNRVTQVVYNAEQKHGVELTKDEIKDLATNKVDFGKAFPNAERQPELEREFKSSDLEKRTDYYARTKHADIERENRPDLIKSTIGKTVENQLTDEKLQGMTGKGRKELREELTNQLYDQFEKKGMGFDLSKKDPGAMEKLNQTVQAASTALLEDNVGQDKNARNGTLYKDDNGDLHRQHGWKNTLKTQVDQSVNQTIPAQQQLPPIQEVGLKPIDRQWQEEEFLRSQAAQQRPAPAVAPEAQQAQPVPAAAQNEPGRPPLERSSSEPDLPAPGSRGNRKPEIAEQAPQEQKVDRDSPQYVSARRDEALNLFTAEQGNNPNAPELQPAAKREVSGGKGSLKVEGKAAEPANPELDTLLDQLGTRPKQQPRNAGPLNADLQSLQEAIGLNDPETLKADLRAPAAKSKPVPEIDEQKKQELRQFQETLTSTMKNRQASAQEMLSDFDRQLAEGDKAVDAASKPPSKPAPMRPREEEKQQNEPVPPSRPAPTREVDFDKLMEGQAAPVQQQPAPDKHPVQKPELPEGIKVPKVEDHMKALPTKEEGKPGLDMFGHPVPAALRNMNPDDLKSSRDAGAGARASGVSEAEHVGEKGQPTKGATPRNEEFEKQKAEEAKQSQRK